MLYHRRNEAADQLATKIALAVPTGPQPFYFQRRLDCPFCLLYRLFLIETAITLHVRSLICIFLKGLMACA